MTAPDAFPWLTEAGYPPRGPCGICGTGLTQRHRIMEAIQERVMAGEAIECADDYELSADLVRRIAAEYHAELDRWDDVARERDEPA